MKNNRHFIASLTGKIKFIFSQSKLNLRKNFLIGLTFAICFSLVAGFSLIGESAQFSIFGTIIEESNTIGDVKIEFLTPPRYLDPNYDAWVTEQVYNTDLAPYIEGTFNIGQLATYGPLFLNNLTVNQTNLEYLNESDYTQYQNRFSWVFGDENFYDTDRFDESIYVLEGNYPQNESEILIDLLFADVNNYSVGETYNISYFVLTEYTYPVPTYAAINPNVELKIAGIYAPIKNYFQILDEYYSTYNFYHYDTKTGEIEFSEDSGGSQQILDMDLPIFSYFDLTVAEGAVRHPMAEIQDIHPVAAIIEPAVASYSHRIHLSFSYGMGINLDHTKIKLGNIGSFTDSVENAFNQIETITNNRVDIESDIIFGIQASIDIIRLVQYILFALMIPVLLFAIIIGSIAIKNETINRLEEFLLLRSKGVKTRTISMQIITESLTLALMAAVIGTGLGIPIFMLLRTFINDIFLYIGVVSLPFVLSTTPLTTTIITGLITSLMASISSLILVKRLPTHKLLKIIGQDSLDGDFTENAIFDSKSKTSSSGISESTSKGKHFVKEESNETILSKEEQKQILKEKKILAKRKAKLDKTYQKSLGAVSKNPLKLKQFPLAYLYIFMGLVPIILMLLSIWAQNENVPDFILKIFNSREVDLYTLLPFTMILVPIFLTIGIIRLIGIEKKQILARIAQKLSQPTLGKLSRLLGLESIRKKQYSRVTSILGVFVGIMLFANSFLYTYLDTPLLDYQARAGADMNAIYVDSIQNDFDSSLQSIENLSFIESEFKNITGLSNNSIVNDVTSVIVDVVDTAPMAIPGSNSLYTADMPLIVCYTNFSKLYDILSEDNKFLPDNSIKVLKNLDPLHSSGVPNVILTSGLAEFSNVSTGDSFDVTFNVYNESYIVPPVLDMPEQLILPTVEYTGRVTGIVDLIPGLWLDAWLPVIYSPFAYYYPVLPLAAFVDISVFPEHISESIINYSTTFLFDLQDNVVLDQNLTSHMEDKVDAIMDSWFISHEINFYVDNFDEYTSIEGAGGSTLNFINYGFIIEFGIIGIVLAVGIAVLLISFQQNNKYFNGILLARGFGKKGIFKLAMNLVGIIIFISFLIGGIIGIASTFFTFRVMTQWSALSLYGPIPIPIKINWGITTVILGIIPLSIIALFSMSYISSSKKSVSNYFRKF